jgi:hypothetical protein
MYKQTVWLKGTLIVVMLSGLWLWGCAPSAEPMQEQIPIREQGSVAPREGEGQSALPTPTASPASASEANAISSAGQVSSSESQIQGGTAIISGSGPASGKPEFPPDQENTMVTDTSNWQVYVDDTYGYEIRYPPNYVIVEKEQQLEPKPVSQVLFQDQGLAHSDTAALQPPQFSVAVFDNRAQIPLEQWLQSNGLLGGAQRLQMEPYRLAGVQGVRVISPLMIAPNEFYYVAKGNYIYKLTPMGKYSEQMLATFTFR